MIYLEKINIHEFRGIRDLELNFCSINFAICGPNGTGKSGIVDAIEFALTGDISRLKGRGTGDLSVKDHAPHVDKRGKPEESYVELTFKLLASDKIITLKRDVKNKNKPSINPNDEETVKALEYINNHPEFVLSRREIIKYVMAEPSKRSEEIQSLLKLDKLDKLRANFQKIANNYEKKAKFYENQKTNSKNELLKALGIHQSATNLILEEVNKRRKILFLSEIKNMGSNTSFKEGMVTTISSVAISRIPKKQALEDIKNLKEKFDDISLENFNNLCAKALSSIKTLNQDSSNIKKLTKESLFQSSKTLFDNKQCPVCDTEWDAAEFQDLLNKKLEDCEEIKRQKKDCEDKLIPIIEKLQKALSSAEIIIKYCNFLTNITNIEYLKEFLQNLSSIILTLKKFLPLEESLSKIENYNGISNEIQDLIKKIEHEINNIPEPTEQEKARDYLVVAEERLNSYRKISRDLELCRMRHTVSYKICQKYNEVTTTKLDEIYKAVETSFKNLYRIINHDDESKFNAKLTPSSGKLGFDVDFYGRGYFPPGAYHSEGHQDGMGLCLYLALMKHLLGENFTLAVLDDVLMSVDSGHRREVCTLLKREFPDTQFILTTHDDIWLRHMGTAGLIGKNNFMHFRTWTVDQGPTEWNDRNVWQEIDAHLNNNDVRAAASLLRHYLEYLAKEICHRLKASVQFTGDAQYTLGDLLPSGTSELRKLVKKGKNSSISWSKKEEESKIIEFENRLDKMSKESEVEKWQLNSAVHFNELCNLQVNDFKPVVESIKGLMECFECKKCNAVLYLVAPQNIKQSVRCDCGDININLISRK